ncbi:DUF3016 domain-containing protein [Variovorax rhizosphaerae]|uniref:DUF3016 domain-containing protein n=1 Tax=Variovorax rhizosphaerae TaxID=1836200 RepID=A0ABU8WUS4_9BURK
MLRLSSLLPGGLLAIAVTAAHADVAVNFIDPAHYTDAAYSHAFANEKDRAEVQRDITQHLERLAERSLPPDETLTIDVRDIDLAGWFEPWNTRMGHDVRILRDITWPRIKLAWALKRGDELLASGEERLVDMNYLMVTNTYPRTDRLRYERPMLDAWFRGIVGRREGVGSE